MTSGNLARLPVAPEYYLPIVTTPAEAFEHWKAIDRGRRRFHHKWTGPVVHVINQQIREIAIPAARRSSTPGQAQVLVEQWLKRDAEDRWLPVLARLYGDVSGDFARRTARGLKAFSLALERKATPEQVLAWLEGEIEDRWLQVVGQWLAQEAGRKITRITDDILWDIRRVLARGVREGWSIPTIARHLQDVGHDLISRRRGVLIARTEVIAASNLGARAGAVDTGLDLDHGWLATPGPRTRPAHASASGQTKPMEEPFIVMGEELMFPGDGSRGASVRNLANCRCTVVFTPR